MKKTTYFLPVLGLFLACFSACRNDAKNENAAKEAATFGTVRMDSTTKNVHQMLSYPLFTGENADNLNGALLKMFTGDTLPVKSMRQFLSKQNIFGVYAEDMKGEQGNEDLAGMQYEEIDSVFVGINKAEILTLANSYYTYSGGAHGLGGMAYQNINPKTGAVYRLDDFFKPNYKTQLTQIGEKCFKNQVLPDLDLKPTDKLSEENGWWFDADKNAEGIDNIFYLSDNFAVTEKGILFHYSSYEVAAYALGTPEFTISIDQLKPFLKDEWLAIFTK
jgi:hypothetical protein